MTRFSSHISSALLLTVMMGFSLVTITTSVSHDHPLPVEVVESSLSETETNPDLIVSVIPEEISATVGDTFVIDVAISALDNVTDLFAWQVHVHFDPRILQCVNVSLSPDHVFSCAYTVNDLLEEHNYTEIDTPLQKIVNREGYILAGEALIGKKKVSLNGSATLCQIRFKAVYVGQSAILLNATFPPGTYILDPELKVIVPSLLHGKVTCT